MLPFVIISSTELVPS